MQTETTGYKIWRVIYPLLIYLAIQFIVSFAGSLFVSSKLILQADSSNLNAVASQAMNEVLKLSVLLTTISAVLTIPFMILFYIKDIRKNKISVPSHRTPVWAYFLIAAAGAAACIGGNIIITISQLQYIFTDYQNVADLLYSGNFIVQLAGIGIIVPIAEELIFRALIYNRMKRYLKSNLYAMVLSSLFFAFYHGNMVQGIYAFIIGFIMAYIYEKFGSIIAPVLFHICCNIPAIFLQKMQIEINSFQTAIYIAIGCVLLLACLIYLVNRLLPEAVFKTDGSHDNSAFSDGPIHQNRSDGQEKNIWPPKNDQSSSEQPSSHTGYSVDDYYPKNKEDDE